MSVVQTFSDRVSFKALAISLAIYVALSAVLLAVLVVLWMPSGVPAEGFEQLAQTDLTLLLWQNILGVVLGVLCGYLAARLSGAHGLRNSLAAGVLVTFFGVPAIYLHPSHPLLMKIGILVLPIPLMLLGGWIALRRAKLAGGRDHA